MYPPARVLGAIDRSAGSLAARAQQPAMPVIGFFNSGSPNRDVPFVAAFMQGLKATSASAHTIYNRLCK
jgi:hypothetical protein